MSKEIHYRGKRKALKAQGKEKQEECAWGKKKGEGIGMLQRERAHSWERRGWGKSPACLRKRKKFSGVFLLWEFLPGALRGEFQWNIHQPSRHVLSPSSSLPIGWCWVRSHSLVHVAGPVVSLGVALSGFAVVLCLQLKHYRGLDIISL